MRRIYSSGFSKKQTGTLNFLRNKRVPSNCSFLSQYFYCFHISRVCGPSYRTSEHDLRLTKAKNKKVLPRNFFYSRRKLGKKLEAFRKKQFSSSGVWDVLYLTLHPNRFVYDGIFLRSFEHFITLYRELVLLLHLKKPPFIEQ